MNKQKSTNKQNLWKTVKAVLRENFIAMKHILEKMKSLKLII